MRKSILEPTKEKLIPIGLCQCGCGCSTPISKRTISKWGRIKGQPLRYLPNHWNYVRERPPKTAGIVYWGDVGTPKFPLGECQCGCGTKTTVSHTSSTIQGYIRGRPRKYCNGHGPGVRNLDAATSAFWSNVDRNSAHGCWLWKPTSLCNGYGVFHYNRKNILTHRFSWLITFGPIPHGLFVCHACDTHYPIGDISYRRCVRPDHLFLGDNAENMRDAARKGRMPRGERSVLSKLTSDQVLDIRKRYTAGEPLKAIAADHRISDGSIYPIAHGKRWTHIPLAVGQRKRKLSEQSVSEIRARVIHGETYRSLAKEYGITASMVRLVALRQTWKHIP
jgi:hypothetical protein